MGACNKCGCYDHTEIHQKCRIATAIEKIADALIKLVTKGEN